MIVYVNLRDKRRGCENVQGVREHALPEKFEKESL